MPEQESYLLAPDVVETARIVKQYRATTVAIGGVIAPELKHLVDEPLTAVLDIGCGTAGWLLDVRKHYPSVKYLAGLDISDRMFPADRSGLDLRIGNVCDSLPEEWNAAFDVVNVRYVFLWINSKDWSRVLEHIKKVLKPGGVIQVGSLICMLSFSVAYVTHYFWGVLQAADPIW
jgi:SAM-dependent methyltransferase